MKRIMIIFIAGIFSLPCLVLGSETFLGAPVFPGAKIVKKTEARLELIVPQSYDKVMAFYKKALKGLKDIRIREWKKSSYIEDDSNRPWHSITISKGGDNETVIVILKDNWTWIMGTVFLLFIGAFIVLLVLFVALSVSGAIISRIVQSKDESQG